MRSLIKSICTFGLVLTLSLSGLSSFAQADVDTNDESQDLSETEQTLKLHWKKLDASDFLIRRNNDARSVAILPVRGQHLVRVRINSTAQFSVSNGSGLFQKTEVEKTTTNDYLYQNATTGLVWLKIEANTTEELLAYTAVSPYYSNTDLLYPLSSRAGAQGGATTRFKLTSNSDRIEKILIDQDKSYSFEINAPGILLFRHQIDYEQIDGQFDVLYQVSWQGSEELQIRNYTTRPEVGRLYDAQCLHQLGQRKDSLINIEKAGRYEFRSSEPIQAEFYLLSERQVLLDKRSKSAPDLRASIEKIESDNAIVNNFNTYIDQNLYHEALNELARSEDNKQILSLIRAKHSFFKPLHPIRLQAQNMLFAYYSIYSDPELPTNKNNEFYINENLTDAITKKISTGYFYPIGSSVDLEYAISTETFENRLRIALANMQPGDSEITLVFDTGEQQTLSVESSFTQINKKTNVVDVGLTILNQNQLGELATLSSEFATKKPVAPFLNSVTGLIDIPANAKSFRVKSTDPNVWISISYPQRSFYRSFEFGQIEAALIEGQRIDELNAFVNEYSRYKSLQSNSTLNDDLERMRSQLDTVNTESSHRLQAWTPYYREIYNSELKLPAQANTQIKLFSLPELTALNQKLLLSSQYRLRKDTLLAHVHYSPQREVREYAYREFLKQARKNERYRQILELGQLLLIRHGDNYVLNDIVNMYQRIDQHKKAVFYASLDPDAVRIDIILASLFYLRQWGLFEALVERSENTLIWNNLRLFQQTTLQEYLGSNELAFIDELGYSWVNEDRFLLNYKNSELIQSTNTLATKQVAKIDGENSATITLKGPLNLRLRASTEFADNRYIQDKFKLNIQSVDDNRQVSFHSVPANSWLNSENSLVGTFGKVDLAVPAGFHEYKLNAVTGSAYLYIENKRNLLGLNLDKEETVDAEFVRENAQLYNRRGANRKRNIGYLKSSCRRLRRLVQRPLRTFQPVDIDLSLRDDWIQQRLLATQTGSLHSSWLESTLQANSSLKVATKLGNTCAYKQAFSEQCMDALHESMQTGKLDKAVQLLNYLDRYPEADSSSYRNDVFDQFEWQLQKTVKQSDGRINIDSAFLQEDNPYILALEDDFSDEQLSSLFITGSKIQGFRFARGQKQNRFEFKRISQNLINARGLTINYQIDAEPVESFQLAAGATTKDFELGNDQSELKFWLAPDSANAYVSIFHSDTELTELSKEYFVASADTPVLLNINGPQRLKVVSQSSDGLRSIQEQDVPVGRQLLEFDTDNEETYYRFFTLKPSFSPRKEKIVQFNEGKQILLNAAQQYRSKRSGLVLTSAQEIKPIAAEIYNQKKSTYDLSISHGRSLDEEQENTGTQADQFTDITGQYRFFSPDNNYYWSADGKLRSGDGYTALFANLRLDWLPQNSPFEYTAYANDWIYSGEQNDLNVYNLGLRAAYNISYKYNHRFSTRLGIFYRDRLGDSLNSDDFRQLPNVIWSAYKEDHKFGWNANQAWTYNAYKDTQVYANARIQSNQDLISFDYAQLGFGARQLYDTASLDAGFVSRSYLSDDDRDESFNSNRFRLSADWLFRSSEDQAFKVGLSYFNNFSAKDSAYAINFTWLNHRGNYLEDYRPGEYRFRQTRELRLLENAFEDQQPQDQQGQ